MAKAVDQSLITGLREESEATREDANLASSHPNCS